MSDWCGVVALGSVVTVNKSVSSRVVFSLEVNNWVGVGRP